MEKIINRIKKATVSGFQKGGMPAGEPGGVRGNGCAGEKMILLISLLFIRAIISKSNTGKVKKAKNRNISFVGLYCANAIGPMTFHGFLNGIFIKSQHETPKKIPDKKIVDRRNAFAVSPERGFLNLIMVTFIPQTPFAIWAESGSRIQTVAK